MPWNATFISNKYRYSPSRNRPIHVCLSWFCWGFSYFVCHSLYSSSSPSSSTIVMECSTTYSLMYLTLTRSRPLIYGARCAFFSVKTQLYVFCFCYILCFSFHFLLLRIPFVAANALCECLCACALWVTRHTRCLQFMRAFNRHVHQL